MFWIFNFEIRSGNNQIFPGKKSDFFRSRFHFSGNFNTLCM